MNTQEINQSLNENFYAVVTNMHGVISFRYVTDAIQFVEDRKWSTATIYRFAAKGWVRHYE